MSQDFSIQKLQSLIAKTIKFEFGKEEDVRKRAVRLSKELNKRRRFVLIIDDLWNPINIIEVGIPIGSGCKLIITSRSIEVCRQTDCQVIKNVEPLNEEETWILFKSLACNLPFKVEKIARSVAKECAGLPLAIFTISRSLKGVDDRYVWSNALLELQSATIRKDDMEEKVFRILRYSYNSLNDQTLQQCFLYCALFLEDENIDKQELITYLIVEGIIDPDIHLMQAKYDKGLTMLNKLTNVSLLESCFDGHGVKMHDMMRDMAIQIIEERQPSIIEARKGLLHVPDEKYWRKDLMRVSLVWNDISAIPQNFSPSCPHLSTLLLHGNEILLSIANSFCHHFQGLKVLSLSSTAIKELPESVGGLKNLTALLLRYSNISYIPTLSNLNSFQYLDLLGCYNIEKVPDGLEYLSNLTILRLSITRIVEFPTGILPKLFCLQYLEYDNPSKNAEELGCLRRLECLKWCFPVVGVLLTFDTLISNVPRKQMKFCLVVSQYDPDVFEEDDDNVDRTVMLNGGKILGELKEMHLQIDCLVLNDLSLENGRGLCSHIPAGLKQLCIDDCGGIVFLFSLATSYSIFQSLEKFFVTNMKEQIVLFLDSENMVPLSLNPTFSFSLKVLLINNCSLKKLLPHRLLSYLLNLEIIEVRCASDLEEIISAEENSHTLLPSLPNLRELYLSNLQSLKRICKEQIKCECLQSVSIIQCMGLQNISIPLPLPHIQAVRVQPKRWWESVEWGQPDQKNVLPCVFV